jgi:sugar O-acyltransferase (sialic acid O-acetyltransferase NeuD family)
MPARPAMLMGYGAHGRDIEEIWKRRHPVWRLEILDDDPRRGVRPRGGERCFVGVNWPLQRRELVRRYEFLGPRALVDRSVVIGAGCEVGDGVVIAPGAILLRDVVLGEHVHVNFNASMTRCEVGAFTTIAPAATICGDVTIGEAVLIGCGAIVKNGVRIGDEATVGAGAVVVKDVEAGATVVGMPARQAVAV